MFNYDLVPQDHYEKRNPMALPFLYPTTLNLTSYNRQLQQYTNNQMLDQLQRVAKQFNAFVVPASVLHWRRRKKFTAEGKRHRISNNAYFVLQVRDMTAAERAKLKEYAEEIA